MAIKVKTIFDTVFKCACGCDSELDIGDFGDGQFTFSVMEIPSRKRSEVVIGAKEIERIIKILQKGGKI